MSEVEELELLYHGISSYVVKFPTSSPSHDCKGKILYGTKDKIARAEMLRLMLRTVDGFSMVSVIAGSDKFKRMCFIIENCDARLEETDIRAVFNKLLGSKNDLSKQVR